MNKLANVKRQPAFSTLSNGILRAIVSRPQDRKWFEAVPGERLAVVVHSSEVGGAYSVMESVAAPNSASPLHYHQEEEVFLVLEGVMTFVCGGQRIEAGPGTIVAIPAGAHHAWRNRGTGPVRMLATFTPGGVEDLFTRIAGLSPDQVAALAADFGTFVVGPPLAD